MFVTQDVTNYQFKRWNLKKKKKSWRKVRTSVDIYTGGNKGRCAVLLCLHKTPLPLVTRARVCVCGLTEKKNLANYCAD